MRQQGASDKHEAELACRVISSVRALTALHLELCTATGAKKTLTWCLNAGLRRSWHHVAVNGDHLRSYRSSKRQRLTDTYRMTRSTKGLAVDRTYCWF
jgi:hypothetical protein